MQLLRESMQRGDAKVRKYAAITKIYLKAQFIWRADTIFNMLFTITKVIFAYLLWGIIFEEREMIAGFTFSSMLSYYIISSFLGKLEMSGGISSEISTRIRNGTFSKYMIIPVSIQKYFIAMEVGLVIFYLGFDLLAAIVWVVIFRIDFVLTNQVGMVLCAIVMFLLGLFFMVQLNYYIGLLALKYEDVGTFLMIKNNIMSLITGSIVPLALFPQEVISIMKLFPFYYVTYLPSMLLTGRCGDEALTGILVLCAWCTVMYFVIKATWQMYRRKYDGVGI